MRKATSLVFAIGCCTAAAAWSQQTYSAGPGLAQAIPDNTYNGTLATMLCHSIAVPADGLGGGDFVAGVTGVVIGMAHTFVGDLVIKLVSPAATVVTLVSRPGVVEIGDDGNDAAGFGENSNLSASFPLTYNENDPDVDSESMGRVPIDLATGSVICQDGGTPCVYEATNGAAAAGDLDAAFDNQSKIGSWQLCIADAAGADTGTLDQWSLTIVGQATPVELQSFTVD